jgi:hypothetical protein
VWNAEQFNQAQLSAYNNYWADIIDATPVRGDGRNFQLIPDVSLLYCETLHVFAVVRCNLLLQGLPANLLYYFN